MAKAKPHGPPFLKSLSARLLVLTILFVMLGEVLIYAPSVARYRKTYLEERIIAAHLATLALQLQPPAPIDPQIRHDILANADSYNIVLRKADRSILILGAATPEVDDTYDLREPGFFGWIEDAFTTLAHRQNRVLRVIGVVPKDPNSIVEVVLDEQPLRKAMIAYSWRILGLSIVISLITAVLVYVSLQWLLVAPIRHITESLVAFRAAPEDESTTLEPSSRSDEMGIAQRELAVMQQDLRTALVQKTRLAALGAAVAKINHDLRNSLATATLASDRLAASDDPTVKRVLPRLFESIDRAVDLCTQTLNYAREATPRLRVTRFPLRDLVDEAGSAARAGVDAGDGLAWRNEVEADTEIAGDRDQLYRVFVNLGRNSYEAGANEVGITCHRDNGRIQIDVADNGPGLPEMARERLFVPFTGSAKTGGTGLGLVIARDVMRAHNGDIILAETGPGGTVFCLDLPDPDDGDIAN